MSRGAYGAPRARSSRPYQGLGLLDAAPPVDPPVDAADNLLLETGDSLLLETGDKLLLE